MSEKSCNGTVKIVGTIKQSPARRLGQCTTCHTVHLEDGSQFEPIHGTIGDLTERLAVLNQSGEVSINARGRCMKLGKFAGHFGR